MLSEWQDRLHKRTASPFFRYALSFCSMAGLALLAWIAVRSVGTGHPWLNAAFVLGFFVGVLGSAWLGYGPGLMVCVLVLIIPRIISTNARPAQPDLLRFILLAVISLLVSRIGQTSRRRESELRHTAEELEQRVKERTAEAVRSAEAMREAMEGVREQAQLLDLAHDAILSLELGGIIRFWNRGAETMYRWTREEAIGRLCHELLHTEFPEPLEEIEARLQSAGRWEGELVHTRKDGSRLTVNSRWALRRGTNGEPRGSLEINTDVTERRRIEDQLRHTQKLESLGVLAGGVAHDFNNLLTGILGNASLALDEMGDHAPNRPFIEEAIKAAERAADLTRQLLAYAGKGRFVLRIVNLSALVSEISGLVQSSIPKTVQLRLQMADEVPGVEADPGQLQQIVMNLVINGAEAIGPEGGTVLVRTMVQKVDEQYIHTLSSESDALRPGEYVCLEVHDTGAGMDEEILARIFDPFFTTKFAGRGLGLSAVLGIVRSHKGALKVYSKPGKGTIFKVLFPAARNAVASRVPTLQGDLAGGGTILVVDDEHMVRQTARSTLERYGYRAVLAENGAQAVDLYVRSGKEIAMVLLDLTMPVMNGEEALRQIQTLNPRVRVLLSSGYNEVEAVQRFAGKGLSGFIQKPYTSAALARKIKEVLTR